MTNYNNYLTNKVINEDLVGTVWLGEIVDINDPEKLGRAKIRVFEKFDELDDDVLPWASPAQSTIFGGGGNFGAGSFSCPKKSSIVRVTFESGDIYSPEFFVIENLNMEMREELSVGNNYENAQVLLWDSDEKVKVLYTKDGGLRVFFDDSHLTIDPAKHITLEHKGGSSKMTMIEGVTTQFSDTQHYMDAPVCKIGNGASHPATKCDMLFQLLGTLGTMIDSKVPPTPGVAKGLVDAGEAMACSAIVKIAD